MLQPLLVTVLPGIIAGLENTTPNHLDWHLAELKLIKKVLLYSV